MGLELSREVQVRGKTFRSHQNTDGTYRCEVSRDHQGSRSRKERDLQTEIRRKENSENKTEKEQPMRKREKPLVQHP